MAPAFAEWRTRVRIFIAAAMLGLLAGAAYAKDFPAMEVPQKQIDERAYRDSINRIPDKPTTSDPWGSVRNTGGTNNQTKKSPDSK
jgi:hypothetical protein